MDYMWILAQVDSSGVTSEPFGGEETETATGTQAPSDPCTAGKQTKGRPPLGIPPWLLLGLMFVMMYFILFRGPKKKQQQHKQMVQALERNDRVRTIGGIIGTVVDVKGDEITLKIDESNNTKIKVISSAIGKNMTKEEA